MTFPDPYAQGGGQEAIQPPPGQGSNPPPGAAPGYGQAPPSSGFTPAPPVPAGYGYGQYPAAAVPQGMYFDQESGLMLPDGTQLASVAGASAHGSWPFRLSS